MNDINKIQKLFEEKFPNYPIIAIWDAGEFYLVSIEIKNGNELSDGYFKVGKTYLKIDEKWAYQSHLAEFRKIIAKPALFLRR